MCTQINFELESLSHAKNYQKWMMSAVEPYLGDRILELGSGIGNMSQWVPQKELLVLSELEESYISRLKDHPSFQAPNTSIVQLDLGNANLGQFKNDHFDTIVSFNVMEHIQDDLQSLRDQVNLLRESNSKNRKRIVIFAPAMKIAYGEFDKKFDHFRRYEAKGLKNLFNEIDPKIKTTHFYFNVLSLLPWIIQGRVLKKNQIKLSDIKILEKIIPFWRPFDFFLMRVLRLPLGQSIVFVAEV
jgi:SAM-dependent methyltransferase